MRVIWRGSVSRPRRQAQSPVRDANRLLRDRRERRQSRSLRRAPNEDLRSCDFPARRRSALLALQSLGHPTHLAAESTPRGNHGNDYLAAGAAGGKGSVLGAEAETAIDRAPFLPTDRTAKK